MNKLLMLGVAAVAMAVAVPAQAEPGQGPGGKKDMFALHDTNSDGKVTKEEFLSGAEKKFSELDTNKDGAISKEEHEARKAQFKEKMKERYEKMKEHRGGEGKPPAEAPAQ